MCFAYFCISTIAHHRAAVVRADGAQRRVRGAADRRHVGPHRVPAGRTAGIVAGGFLASRSERHDRIASAGLFAGALLVLLIATWPPARALLLPLFALTGFALGCTGPSRDLIVRDATPPGAAGRVYGFVYSGLDLGGVLGPLWFGFLLDHGAARGVLFAVAACFLHRDRHRVAGAPRAGAVARVGAAVRRAQPMDLGIAGKRALVCAASKGLGRGCAQALASAGATSRSSPARRPICGRRRKRSAPARRGRCTGSPPTSRPPRAGGRRSRAAPSPTSSSTTPADRRPGTSATGTATRGSARSTRTC